MSKHKIAKYKITDTDIDKKFIGKQVTVEKIKSKGGTGGDGGRKPGSTNKITLSKLSNKVDNLTDSLNKLANIVIDGFERQEKFNRQQLEFNKTIGNRLDIIVRVNNLKE